MKAIACVIAPLALATAALAATPPAAGTYAGRWDFSGDSEGTAACVLEMKTPQIIGGYEIALPATCKAVFPGAEEIYAWRPSPGGGIAFADATRHTLLDFRPTQDGAFVARTADGRGYVLGRARPSRPQGLGGTWALNAPGGKRLCTFKLSVDRTGKAGALARGKPCAPPWSAKAFGSWTLKGERLVLSSPKGAAVLTFRRGDPVTFESDSGRGDTMYFVRP